MKHSNINLKIAPKEWAAFKVWHGKACKSDVMTTEERWEFMGNKIPKKGDNKRTKKAVE